MAYNHIYDPSEWFSKDPTKYFIKPDSLNHPDEHFFREDVEDLQDSYSGDICGYARAVIKAIVIARQKNILPDEFDRRIKSPEDAAQLATEGSVMMDTIVKLASGDIDTYEKLANRLFDTIHVLALSSIELVVQKGLPLAENAFANVAEMVGQALGSPGLGMIVQQLFDAFAPILRNRSRALLVAGCNKLNEFFTKAKEYIFEKIREHQETNNQRQKTKKEEIRSQTKPVKALVTE